MAIDQRLIRDLSHANIHQDCESLVTLLETWNEKLLAKAFAWLFFQGCFSLNEIVDLLNALPYRHKMLVYSDLPVHLQALVLAKLRARGSQAAIRQKINTLT
ncbi:hypothetical protein SAMN05660443_1182 [Marinospirillum celere]|uniref:Uncharacterized protein n=1 Tax=Marinospirillum celere TaxID=1122252 RepID=A0A1I1FRS1_9GAMM|nr:hypothetical protein [Marinospirillum celere]SFC02259.1 hypothetical protein SAMN05660443_1182 [Marinospirillum celere]